MAARGPSDNVCRVCNGTSYQCLLHRCSACECLLCTGCFDSKDASVCGVCLATRKRMQAERAKAERAEAERANRDDPANYIWLTVRDDETSPGAIHIVTGAFASERAAMATISSDLACQPGCYRVQKLFLHGREEFNDE